MKKIIIAIDGFAGCGKSTLAKLLAKQLDYIYVDTGAMYRAVTYFFLKHRVAFNSIPDVEEALRKINISFINQNGLNRTFLNGKDVEEAIRSLEISQSVSKVAAIPIVRKAMVAQQQEMGKTKGVVMDGRDIGTVVFPEAELKLFLTADFPIRTQRRFEELKDKQKGINYEKVAENLSQRDHIDSTRADSPLKKADDALEIDNSHLTTNELVEKAMELVRTVALQ